MSPIGTRGNRAVDSLPELLEFIRVTVADLGIDDRDRSAERKPAGAAHVLRDAHRHLSHLLSQASLRVAGGAIDQFLAEKPHDVGVLREFAMAQRIARLRAAEIDGLNSFLIYPWLFGGIDRPQPLDIAADAA